MPGPAHPGHPRAQVPAPPILWPVRCSDPRGLQEISPWHPHAPGWSQPLLTFLSQVCYCVSQHRGMSSP